MDLGPLNTCFYVNVLLQCRPTGKRWHLTPGGHDGKTFDKAEGIVSQRWTGRGRAYHFLRRLLLADIPSFAASFNFSNTTPIVVPGSGTMGPASLYPSTISVSGLLGTVTNVNVSLFGLTHTFPDDLDILLVGPTGAKTMLMSDAGGSHNIYNVNLTFSAGTASGLANSSVISSGTYRPTNHGNSDSFPSPAPGGPYGSSLAVFNGLNPNGTWSLYVNDDQICDIGGIRGG